MQKFTARYFTDDDGHAAGGTTFGTGFAIGWQNGPLGRGGGCIEPNGAFVCDIIGAAINRLMFFQGRKLACEENRLAIEHLHIALGHMSSRTADREDREVAGTHEI